MKAFCMDSSNNTTLYAVIVIVIVAQQGKTLTTKNPISWGYLDKPQVYLAHSIRTSVKTC